MSILLQSLDKAVELASKLREQAVASFSDAALAHFAATQNVLEPIPSDESKPDQVRVFRHVRDGTVAPTGAVIAPSGGLTFYIEIDYPQKQITFATCVQSMGQNFQYRLGRNVSKGRFEHGQTVSGPYDANKSLIQNVQDVLDDVNQSAILRPEVYQMLIATKIDPAMVQLAGLMLRTFTESLPREVPGDPK
jgi:hypothetical protein